MIDRMGNVLSEELAAQSHQHGKPVTKHNMTTLAQQNMYGSRFCWSNQIKHSIPSLNKNAQIIWFMKQATDI